MEKINDMASFVSFVLVGLFVPLSATVVTGSFDPFMDNRPYSIIWGNPLKFDKEQADLLGDRHILITTNNQERYQCILPQTVTDKKDGENQYTGPSVIQLLKPLFGQNECSYRIESYWTYELCHGKHLKQYHESREPGTKPKLQEYLLGFGNHRDLEKGSDKEENSDDPLPVRELDGEELPYYEVIMSDGTKCDLTNQPRKTHVLYVCYPEGRGEVYELKEVSTCEYEVMVLTALLCKHPRYTPKSKPVNEIRCHAFLDSPIKPSQLVNVEQEAKFFQAVGQDFIVPDKESAPPALNPKGTQAPVEKIMYHKKDTSHTPQVTHPPPFTLGVITDKQTLRDFFSGTKCLRGGHGWWQHEICYGKYAKQFHVEKGGKETSIYLGFWDTRKHLQWLQENPLKRPKALNIRRHVSQHYASGNVCDLIGKHRTCEVRLKCIENSKNPHAVMLSLAEPSPCQYVLTVDSALFCPILKNANEDGLFENLDL